MLDKLENMDKIQVMKKYICIFIIIISTNSLFASTGGEVEFTCPLCNTKFNYWVQFSYSVFGQNLDLRQTGAAIIPAPIPKCSNCNFIFNNNFFTEDEISCLKIELEQNNIFEKEPNMPNYFYLARECEIIKRDLDNIIWFFLSALWENRDINKKNFLINITIDYINKLENTSEEYNTYQLVKLDLLRRSGQFNEAKELIEVIKLNKDFFTDYIVEIIDLQIELIENNNQEEHSLPRRK